jgi:hypothetical protein
MDKRRSRVRDNDTRRTTDTGSSTRQSGRGGKRSSGGLGSTFIVMAAVVLVIIIGGFFAYPAFQDKPEAKPKNTGPLIEVYDPRQNRKYQDPWTGKIAGRRVVVKHGMAESDIRNQLGKPTEYSIYDGDVELIYKDDVDRVGVFSASGGRQLRVVFDEETGKLVHYDAPATPEPPTDGGAAPMN